MGNTIYWINGISMDCAHRTENVCCIYQNPRFTKQNHLRHGEMKYTCEITLAPHHEDKIIAGFMDLKSAKSWGIKEFGKLKSRQNNHTEMKEPNNTR